MEARKESENIVLTEITTQKMKWVFSDITENSFHWQHLRSQDGTMWKVRGELFVARRNR